MKAKYRKRVNRQPTAPDYRCRLPQGEAGFNTLFKVYRTNSDMRGIGFFLDKEKFRALTKANCHYCGQPPSQVQKGTRRDKPNSPWSHYTYSGIDRHVNHLGYTEFNSVPCCFTCNRAKANMDPEEFLAWAARLYRHSVEGMK
jgi:hypothetical protein